MPRGAYITQVDMDSPAMKAGIQSGDIISKINGEEILSYESLLSKIIECRIGEEITLTIMRSATEDYIELNITATLGTSTD